MHLKFFSGFFASFCAILFIASCSDSSSSNGFEPIKAGTWTIQTETKASWDGSQNIMQTQKERSLSAVDPINITRPTELHVGLHANFLENDSTYFIVSFTDINITFKDYIEKEYSGKFSIESIDTLTKNIEQGDSNSINGMMQTTFSGHYRCGERVSLSIFHYSILDSTGATIKAYELNATGFSQALDYMVCGESL